MHLIQYVFNLKLISFLLLGFNSIMSLNILLGYFIVLKQQLGCVRNMVALNENLGARLAVGGGVVAGADGEVHLALVRELRGVNLGQGGLLRLLTDQEELLPDMCPDYSPGSPSCCRTSWPHSALCSPTSPCTPASHSAVTTPVSKLTGIKWVT